MRLDSRGNGPSSDIPQDEAAAPMITSRSQESIGRPSLNCRQAANRCIMTLQSCEFLALEVIDVDGFVFRSRCDELVINEENTED